MLNSYFLTECVSVTLAPAAGTVAAIPIARPMNNYNKKMNVELVERIIEVVTRINVLRVRVYGVW